MNRTNTLVFATNNPHKLEELRQLAGARWTIVSLSDIGCATDIPETSPTLEGNALQKARWIKDKFGLDCFADDTGLEVDALGGEPGVRSARYATGSGHDSRANMKLLLENLKDKSCRTARFRTVIALVEGDSTRLFEGEIEGEILESPAGDGGFGYDPVFRPIGWNKTFAEASAEEKNAVSHRGKATRKLMEYLNSKN